MSKRSRGGHGGGGKRVQHRRQSKTVASSAMRGILQPPKPSAHSSTGFVDRAHATYVCDSVGDVQLIATVAQGAGTSQRIGKKIAWKSVQARGHFRAGGTGTIATGTLAIVYDKQPTGTLPAVTDIFNSAAAASFNNDTNSDRFRVMKRVDVVIVGDDLGPDHTAISGVIIDFYLPLQKLLSQFKAVGTGAIGDIAMGALYIVTMGAQPAGTTACQCQVGFRTRYWDLH